jgi:FkbM family methyltransferase
VKILGRRPANVVRSLLHVPEHAAGCVRCFRLFERPVRVIWAYLLRRPPASGVVRLRNGWTIHLSGDPADIVTVVLVFARHDYGMIRRGGVVVDVGANIGVFALYAAYCGATRVLAFEPSAESYSLLQRNVQENGLADVVEAHRLAVTSAERRSVRFPRRSSVMNTILSDGAVGEFDEVPTRTLDAIIEPFDRVDLVKMDCEGADTRSCSALHPAPWPRFVRCGSSTTRGVETS